MSLNFTHACLYETWSRLHTIYCMFKVVWKVAETFSGQK